MIKGIHRLDDDGNPAGGGTMALGISITWQNGPLCVDGVRHKPNGAFVEQVIEAAIDRLEFYQAGEFACDYNKVALKSLYQALYFLNARTADREARGVEGTHAL